MTGFGPTADTETQLVRLSVLAALISTRAPITANSGPAGSATPAECQLADALRGGRDGAPGPEAPALADLLRLAEGTPDSSMFAAGLRQAFLIPDDSHQALAREEPTAAFADMYRRLALPGLTGSTGRRAEAILTQVTSY